MLLGNSDFLDLPKVGQGKVREIYDLGDKLLLLVTDRISAFDVVFRELVPYKGEVLNSLSAFWFEKYKDLVPNHMISTNPAEYPEPLPRYAEQLAGRSMLVKKAEMLPAECIVRGYLEGSAWKEYQEKGTVSGIQMPEGLRRGDLLPKPLFTPSTKAAEGHDVNITTAELASLIGEELAQKLEAISLEIYNEGQAYALERGLILADTKFEFGLLDGELLLCDELLTPDSSRFWDLKAYEPGHAQQSFDKQYLRDYLETLTWDKQEPAPELPAEIIRQTSERYLEAYRLLTGKELVEETP